MISFFIALLLAFLALGIELQGRKKHQRVISSSGQLLKALVSKQAETLPYRARLFSLSTSLLFSLWEAMLWYLYDSENVAFLWLRLLGLLLLMLYLLWRYRVYFWDSSVLQSPLNRQSIGVFYLGFCLMIFAPISALFLGTWIYLRWRQ